jgi:hypothetical protein
MYGRIFCIFLLAFLVAGCGYIASSVPSPEIDGRRVTFRVRIESAETVQVAGDWNNWGMGDGRQGQVLVGLMRKSKRGDYWEKTVELPPGRYKYIFLVNETVPVLDGGNPRIVPDGKGGKANLIILPGV